jgi:hypothetical protein
MSVRVLDIDAVTARARRNQILAWPQTGSVRPQTTARTVAPFFVVTECTHPLGR